MPQSASPIHTRARGIGDQTPARHAQAPCSASLASCASTPPMVSVLSNLAREPTTDTVGRAIEAGPVRDPAAEAIRAATAEVGAAISVDVGEADRAPVRQLAPSIGIAPTRADDAPLESGARREPARHSVRLARANVVAAVAVDVDVEAERAVTRDVVSAVRIRERAEHERVPSPVRTQRRPFRSRTQRSARRSPSTSASPISGGFAPSDVVPSAMRSLGAANPVASPDAHAMASARAAGAVAASHDRQVPIDDRSVRGVEREVPKASCAKEPGDHGGCSMRDEAGCTEARHDDAPARRRRPTIQRARTTLLRTCEDERELGTRGITRPTRRTPASRRDVLPSPRARAKRSSWARAPDRRSRLRRSTP